MKFLYPEFLWGLLILAIPIIIHLFNFKRYKTLYFSSLSFIRHVDQRTKSTQKLKHLLILLSRLLAFIFLVLAFAQPYFSDEAASTTTDKTVVAFYVDNSFSMQAKGAEGELLSQARENVRHIIEEAPLDTRFLIGTNEMSGIEERLLSKVEAFEKIDKITYSPLTRSLSEVLQWQTDLLKKEEILTRNHVQYVLLSDFQMSSGFNAKQLNAENIDYFPVKLAAENISNLYIDSVWYSSPIHKVGARCEINIQLQNKSSRDVKNAEVQVDINDFHKTMYVDLPKDQKVVSSLTYMDKTTGIKAGKVQVMDNQVHFDDAFYISYDVRKNVNVLILSGPDGIENVDLVYQLDDYYSITSKELTSITKNDLENKDLVVINGANEMPKGVVNLLMEFNNAGGTLALFPGKSPNQGQWNNLLSNLKHNLMGNPVSSGNRIKTVNYDDPFFDGVFEKETKNLNLPSVKTVFLPVTSKQSMSQKLVVLQNGLPLLSFVKDNGGSFMFYSSLHPDFGNFSADALFTAILLRMGELSQRSQPYYITIGSDARYPIYEQMVSETPIHIKNEAMDFIPQSNEIAGVTYLSLNMLNNFEGLRAGNYSVVAEKELGKISLNYNRLESDLTTMSETKIIESLKATGAEKITFNKIGNEGHLSTIDIDKPFSYWKFCIVLTIIFVFTEMLLIRFLK